MGCPGSSTCSRLHLVSEVHTCHWPTMKFHTPQICKTAIVRCVCGAELWVHTLLHEIPVYARFHFGTDHLFTHANNFYQFGRIADLAVHSHIKVPGKKNYSNLHYGWHNTQVKKMTHKQSAQVSTSQLCCWWGPSSKGRLFLIPKVNTDLMFCKGAIYSEFPVLCFGSITPRDHWELSYGITSPLTPKIPQC